MNEQNSDLGILVMNRQNARFFQYQDEKLEELKDFHQERSHLPDNRENFQAAKEGSGGGFIGFGKGQEKHDIRSHDLEVFAKEVAEGLWNLFRNKNFDQLVIVAAKKIENELLKNFHEDLKKTVQESIDANLTNFSWQEILEHLRKHNEKLFRAPTQEI